MRFTAFAKLTRLEHSILLLASVLLGEFLVLNRLPSLDFALLSALPAFFIGLASFALNDFFDLESDRLNKRLDRPLVSGEATPHEAVAVALLGFTFGIAFSVPLSFMTGEFALFKLAFFYSLLAIAYSLKLKDLPLIGNAFIASTMAIAFIFGNLAVSSVLSPSVLVIASLAFIAGLAREITKSVQDMKGDRKARRSRTLPMIMGARYSLALSLALYLLAALLSFIPFFFLPPFQSSISYLLPVLLCDCLLVFSSVSALRKPSPASLSQARSKSLAGIAVGLLAFIIGALYPILLR